MCDVCANGNRMLLTADDAMLRADGDMTLKRCDAAALTTLIKLLPETRVAAAAPWLLRGAESWRGRLSAN